jgi:hypothetical protein
MWRQCLSHLIHLRACYVLMNDFSKLRNSEVVLAYSGATGIPSLMRSGSQVGIRTEIWPLNTRTFFRKVGQKHGKIALILGIKLKSCTMLPSI